MIAVLANGDTDAGEEKLPYVLASPHGIVMALQPKTQMIITAER